MAREHNTRLRCEKRIVPPFASRAVPNALAALVSVWNIVEDRFKRTGQFWKSQSMGRLQALKVARQNGDWAELCSSTSAYAADSLSPVRSPVPTKN